MDAARELFAHRGFHNTTLEEIARHAEFGKGTIYNYFSSKEELLYGIIDRLTSELLAIAQTALGSGAASARGQLLAYANGMIAHAQENADLFSLVLREINHLDSDRYEQRLREIHGRARELWGILARPLRREIRSGGVRPLDPVWLAALFDGMLRTYCMTEYGGQHMLGTNGVENPGASLVDVFFDGVAQRKRKG